VDENGNLVLTTTAGNAQLLRPIVYQTIGGVQRNITGRYVLLGGNRIGFRIGAYDTRKTLVIDPVSLLLPSWIPRGAFYCFRPFLAARMDTTQAGTGSV
jgi:hypothetical protein